MSLAFMSLVAPWTVAQAQDDEQIQKGKYLAVAGDCIACHTAPEGMPFAGGLPMHTPFGVLYSTNITPDKETGIGEYTYELFRQTMHEGKGSAGHLYPAMPYTSYTLLSEEDTQALYAYFMSLPVVSQANRDNEIAFPFNLRFGLGFWKALFAKDTEFKKEPSKSVNWNRGNYLVNALGHCGECHTPRNFTMELDQERPMQGNVIGGFEASDITAGRLKAQGWTKQDLASLFRNGYSSKGTVFGEMSMVVYHSLSRLNDSDMNAVTSYLLDSDNEIDAKPFIARQPDTKAPGHNTYVNMCSGCHGLEGQGKPKIAPAMQSNATINRPSLYNSVAVLLRGIPSQKYNATTAFYAMDSFEELTDQELADLINYMRQAWTDEPPNVTEDQVERIRDELKGQNLIGVGSGHAEF
jgi:mono/diheme cytochrome c family protein